MNFPLILNLTGSVLMIISVFMALPCVVAIIYGGYDLPALALSAAATFAFGALAMRLTRKHGGDNFRHRDVFCAVTMCWALISLFGSLPYMLSGSLGSFTDAYFEAMSGFTTTGATVMTDIEAMPRGVLFWRSLTQWIGGMGIILFALAVLPFLSSGGVHLFKAEVPEITVDRLRPRLVDTAKALWYIYALLTASAFLLYESGGMSIYDALNHALTTMATGGFSTKNASIAHFNSAFIDSVCTVFMLLAGINYSLYFFAFRGQFTRFWLNSEFRLYVGIVASFTAITTLSNYGYRYEGLLESFRYGVFQVASIVTTTGYATADYEAWAPLSQMLIIILMFFGGMIGSTAGGMKQVRVLLMLKQGYRELYQLVHPRAITTLKLDGRHLSKEVLGSIWGFLFLYLFVLVAGTLAITALEVDIVTASASVLSALSNVGPALGQTGPVENYAAIPDGAKWVLSFCMLAGRLELFTVLILFIPRFWKK